MNGSCDELGRITKPALIITRTYDNAYIPHENSLIIAGKIPGAWLIQIENAGHAVMSQYPDKINKILQTFLSTTTTTQPKKVSHRETETVQSSRIQYNDTRF